MNVAEIEQKIQSELTNLSPEARAKYEEASVRMMTLMKEMSEEGLFPREETAGLLMGAAAGMMLAGGLTPEKIGQAATAFAHVIVKESCHA